MITNMVKEQLDEWRKENMKNIIGIIEILKMDYLSYGKSIDKLSKIQKLTEEIYYEQL